jgi:probable HAF family extracellular repeat protein
VRPTGIVIDSNGYLYVCQSLGTRNILKISPDGKSSVVIWTDPYTETSLLGQLAFDNNGNLLCAVGANRVVVINLSSGNASDLSILPSSFRSRGGIAYDNKGDLYLITEATTIAKLSGQNYTQFYSAFGFSGHYLAFSPYSQITTYGQTFTLKSQLRPSFGSASGFVRFYSDGNLIGTAPVINNTAVLTVSNLSSGQHLFTSDFDGNAGLFGSTSDSIGGIIKKANLTINPNVVNKVYGPNVPNLTYTSLGLVNGDQPSIIIGSLSTNALANSSVGQYVITQGNISAGSNYNIIFNNGVLNVTKATVNVIANSSLRIYGSNNPVFPYTFNGLVNNDIVSIFTGSLASNPTSNTPVGNYPISIGSLSAGNNYSINFTPGTLSVTPATLIVNGSSITNQYGNNLPLLTFKYSGLMNGDGISVFSGSLATTANPSSAVALYPITVGNFSAGPNYNINFTNGTLSITKADTYLSLSASPNLTYGSNGTVNARVSGLASVSGTPTGTVSFYDGSTLLGNATLDSNGNSSFSTQSIKAGSHVISAKYLGDLSRNTSSTLINPPSLTNLGVYGNYTTTRAMGVSDDGNVVIGNANGSNAGFRWTMTSGFTNLGFQVYNDTSFDGNSIAGKGPNGTVLWTPNGSQNLGITSSGRPGGLSRDGSTVMGYSIISSNATGYYWSNQLGTQYLGTLGGNDSFSWGSNYDGSIIVGESTISNGDTRAFIYSASSGLVNLGNYANATNIYAYSASSNGQVILGEIVYSNGSSHAMRWTPETGILDLGSLTSSDNFQYGSISSDGNYIVGYSNSGAFIWDPIIGMRSISDLISAQGINLSNWSFQQALSISGNSTNGYNIVGRGTHLGQTRAYLIKGLQPLAPQPLTITINKANSASLITSSSGTSTYGNSVSFYTSVAPISPNSGLPTGSVDFYDGSTKVSTTTLDANGIATLFYSGANAGSHTISARYLGDGNFLNSNSSAGVNLTVNSAALNVTAINSSKLYGANNPTFTYSYSGLVNGDNSSVFSGSLTTTSTLASPVGTYPINRGSLSAGNNYSINFNSSNLTVNPAPLNITISSTSKLYGASLPNFSFIYSGLLYGDAPSLFSGSLTSTATANSPVGTYPISVGTISAGPNYAIVPTNGTLIINPASLAVTGSNQSKSYGANLPDLKYSYSGLVNGDTESVFSGNLTTTATANSPVGSYPITVGSLAAGSNYNIAFTNGTLSVTSSSLLVVTATNKTKVYGDILPTRSYTYSGLINGDTSAVFTGNLSTTATSESAVGIYGITQGNLSAGSNYAITFNNGTLSVTPAPITVTASNSTKSYGGAIPALNYSYSGLVNGDTSSIFTGGLSTSASTSSGVGNYIITQGSLSAGNNYSIIYTNGTLSVIPANLSVSANNLTKTFGAAIPPLTYVYTGLVNNDSSSVFSGNLVTSATSSSVVANYPITRGNLSAGNNYNISFVNGTLSVIKSGSSTSISAPSTAVAGTNVTISAIVTATAPGAGIPTGSVQFYDATTLIGTVSVNSNAQASILTGSLSLGNHTLSAIYVGDSSFNTSTSGSANITIQAGTLSIQSFSSDASAVTVKFNQAIATSSLQINDAYTGNILTEVADLTVTDRNGQSVKGSMIVASDAKSVTFIKTGVAFANGTYTVRLRSGSNAFRNTSGEFLDGNNDGVAGGDYVTTFAVTNNSRVLSIPDVVRGPGQAVRVNTTDLGVPVKVNDGTDIFAFEVSVNYDPALMSVTDVVVPSNLSSFLQISYNSSVAGRIDVVGIAVNGLPGGSQNLFYVNGTVPNGVLYRSKAELTLSDVNLYKLDNSTISTTLDQGVQLVSYIGDVTGDGRYNALDPLRIQRYLVNLDRWFAQFPLVDPLLVADVTGDGKVNALDALYMQRYLVNLPVPYLSAPPVTSVTQSGLDPIIRLPKNLSAMRGQVVQVPVELQNTDSQAINVNSFEVAVQIDPQAFRLMKIKSSDKIRTHYDDVRGTLIIAGILPEVTLQPGESMIICSLQIKISAHTKATDYVLNLLEDVTIGRAHYATSVNGGTLKLVPAPTNESNDSVDGNIRILERPNRFVSRETFRKSPILKKPRFGFIAR